ncbi:hypothetical protein Tco_0611721, partial [Tanacetum coccineum]
MNKKSYSFDMETFINMLLICPKLSRQKFVDPPFKEEILTFIRELGYPGNIKLLSDVKVDTLPQPWRTFGTIINKCLSGKVQPKPTYVRRSSRTKTNEAPKPFSSKRVKAMAKVAKSGKKKQQAPGLEALSDIALTEAEQMKLAIEKSKTQLHISQPIGSEEDDDEVNVSEHDDDDDDERTKSDNDDEDFVHPKFLAHDDEARHEEVNEEDSFNPRVQTPSHDESTDDDNNDEEVQGANTEEEEMVEKATHEEDEANELYSNETEDTHVILTAPINPEGIDLIFNTEATSLVDVPVTTIVEPPLVFATTLPLSPTPLITHMQQTPFLIPITAPTVSSIPGIVDAYLANKMNKAVKTTVQLQSNKLRDEALAENEAFLNSLD